MKHINESIIGKRGSSRPANWDVLILTGAWDSEFPALYLDNKTAASKIDDIIYVVFQLAGFHNTGDNLRKTISNGSDILVMYNLAESNRSSSQDHSYFWCPVTDFSKQLKSIPDESGNLKVLKNTGRAHIKGNETIQDIFKNNNYFKDRL